MHGQILPLVRLDVARPYLRAGPSLKQALCNTTAWAQWRLQWSLAAWIGHSGLSRFLTLELPTVFQA